MDQDNRIKDNKQTCIQSGGRMIKVAIPLFFIQYHIYIHCLRDRSQPRQLKERARRWLVKLTGKVFLFYLAACIFLPFILFGLYLIKSWLGIDLFSEYHLSDFLPFLKTLQEH